MKTNTLVRIKYHVASLFIAACAIAYSATAQADTVVMNSGQRQVGIVEEDSFDATKITFTTVGGTLSIPRKNIKEIIKESPAESHIALGNEFFKLEKWEQALGEYYEATRLEPDNETALSRLAAAKAKVADQQTVADQATRQQAISLLAEARRLVVEEKFEQALDKLKAAETLAGPLIEKELLASLASLYEAWGRSRLDRLDDRGAVEKFEMALKYGPPTEEIQDVLIDTYKRLPERRTEVIAYYRQKLEKDPGNKEYLYELVDLLQGEGNYEEVTEILVRERKLGELPEKKYSEYLHNGLLIHVRTATDAHDFEKARDYYAVLVEYYPNYDPSYLYYFEFYMRAGNIDPTSYQDHVELARYAEAHNLMSQAKDEYMTALSIDPTGKEANDAIRRMAETDLARARQLAEKDDPDSFYAALNLSNRIMKEYSTSPDIIENAKVTAEIAENKIREHNKAMRKSAQDIAKTGDTYYQQALQYLSEAQNREFDDSVRIYNPVNEASTNIDRAINAWQTALQLDPTMGDVLNGDLNTKIADAQRMKASISQPLPTIRSREFSSD